MLQVGVMHMRLHPSKVSRMYEFAAVAKMEGVELFYFSPGKVNFETKTIRGYVYRNGSWKKKNFDFPKVVINMVAPITDKQSKIYYELRKCVIFTESSIGGKDSIHDILKDTKFKAYLPQTKVASNVTTVMKFLGKHKKIALKPMRGCKGVGVIFIEKNAGDYTVYDMELQYNQVDLKCYLKRLDLSKHVMQEFIVSETKDGLPVDYRIHTQKNGEGKHVLTTIYPRIACIKNKVTNYSQGGYTIDIDTFLNHQFNSRDKELKHMMEVIAIELSRTIDKYYDFSLNELGIDIGLTKDNKVYIYEVNWRPGAPVIFSGELNHAKNLIEYCKYKSKNLN